MSRRTNIEVDTYDRYSSPRPFRSVESIGSMPMSNVFGIILLALIVMNIPRAITGNGFNFSFSALLQIMQDVPAIDITWVSNTFQPITADWGIFNFLRGFLNLLVDSISALAFLGTGIVQVITFVAYFIPKIFGY